MPERVEVVLTRVADRPVVREPEAGWFFVTLIQDEMDYLRRYVEHHTTGSTALKETPELALPVQEHAEAMDKLVGEAALATNSFYEGNPNVLASVDAIVSQTLAKVASLIPSATISVDAAERIIWLVVTLWEAGYQPDTFGWLYNDLYQLQKKDERPVGIFEMLERIAPVVPSEEELGWWKPDTMTRLGPLSSQAELV